ncbi:MAG: alpha-L-fucosidase [Clostridia bacterium]|nr:alpha-L-fucosidase [Clostridia bacterium]
MFERAAYEERVRWFREARFGMFIHWGLYALPARGEWVRSNERMPESQYLPYFDAFEAPDFDPRAWARAARGAGMKYAVLTAKHHDGFCLFDSKLTDFKATNTPFGRDAVREFLDAFRAEGLKVGLYYSLLDWHHPDYPHAGDLHHPDRDRPGVTNEGRDFDRYLDYMHGQVRELATDYGRIDIFWFDFSYGALRGEAWRATELVRMVRSLQPGVLIDNRLEVSGVGFGSLLTGDPAEFSGDFVSPEQIIPPGGITDVNGRDVTWEACVTMNNNWGYCAEDRFFKPASMLIRKLAECVSKGGNLLLNVGPDARGRIPPESLAILREIGQWMEKNGESIYGCGKAGIAKPEYGRLTRKGNTLYYHMMDMPIGYLPLEGVPAGRPFTARWLGAGRIADTRSDWVSGNYPHLAFAALGPDPVPPDAADTVLAIDLGAE